MILMYVRNMKGLMPSLALCINLRISWTTDSHVALRVCCCSVMLATVVKETRSCRFLQLSTCLDSYSLKIYVIVSEIKHNQENWSCKWWSMQLTILASLQRATDIDFSHDMKIPLEQSCILACVMQQSSNVSQLSLLRSMTRKNETGNLHLYPNKHKSVLSST